MSGKRIALAGFIVALLIGIPLTVYLVQQSQETRSHAEAATVLGFDPASTLSAPQTVKTGQNVPLSITINPGTNAINYVKLDITYDQTKLATASANAFTNNTQSFDRIIEGPTYLPGEVIVVLSVSDITKPVTTQTTVGTLTFTALANTTNAPVSVTFKRPGTRVLSSAKTDTNQDVFSSANPAFIAVSDAAPGALTTPTPTPNPGIGGVVPTTAPASGGTCANVPASVQNVRITYPFCPGGVGCTADPTKATCTWDPVTGATSYSISISQVNDNGTSTLVKQDTVTDTTPYIFSVIQNDTYDCTVAAVNSCGAGPSNSITALCAGLGVGGPVASASPTLAPIVPTAAPTNALVIPTATPIQKIPPTGPGNVFVIGGGIMATITVIGGLLFFLL